MSVSSCIHSVLRTFSASSGPSRAKTLQSRVTTLAGMLLTIFYKTNSGLIRWNVDMFNDHWLRPESDDDNAEVDEASPEHATCFVLPPSVDFWV